MKEVQMKEMGFSAACRDYFGMLPGQVLADFMRELTALTETDKFQIRTGLEALGYKIKVI